MKAVSQREKGAHSDLQRATGSSEQQPLHIHTHTASPQVHTHIHVFSATGCLSFGALTSHTSFFLCERNRNPISLLADSDVMCAVTFSF